MQKLIEDMCTGLVDKPESLKVREVEGGRSTIFEVSCDSEDIGKLLGKKGNNIKAIRTIARSVAAKNRRYVEVEVMGA